MRKVLTIILGLSCLAVSAQKKWSLRECVDYATKHNLQVIQNEYSKQMQDLNLKIARRNYLPSVSVSYTHLTLPTKRIV